MRTLVLTVVVAMAWSCSPAVSLGDAGAGGGRQQGGGTGGSLGGGTGGGGVDAGASDAGLPDAGLPDSGLPGGLCLDSTDCPSPTLFFCNFVTSQCEPSCRTQADCSAAVRGQYALSQCAGVLGCQCDQGVCVPAQCSVDGDCGSAAVCRSGECVSAPAAGTVASCVVTPDLAVVRGGSTVHVTVLAQDALGAPVVPASVTWSPGTMSTVVGSPTGIDATYSTATFATPTRATAIHATIGTVSCTADVLGLPTSVPAGVLRVVVLDALSGRPVSGVTISTSLFGATNPANALTDVNGLTQQAVGAASSATVTAFHPDFDYLTIADYPLTSSTTTAGFLVLQLRRNTVDHVGGVVGTMSGIPQSSNTHDALAGLSIPFSLADLSTETLAGPPVPVDVVIGTAISQNTTMPLGSTLGFGAQPIKPTWAARGAAGLCAVPASVTAGTCGTRSAWALSEEIALVDLPISQLAGLGANLGDLRDLYTTLLGLGPLNQLSSTIVRDVGFQLQPTTRLADGGVDVTAATAGFTPLNLPYGQVHAGFVTVVSTPPLPQFGGAFVNGALGLVGANVRGRGWLPLGLGGAPNMSPVDAQVDGARGLTAGSLALRAAPPSNGIEGAPLSVVVLARTPRATSATTGSATTASISPVPGNRLLVDPLGLMPLSVPAFPSIPTGATYNPNGVSFAGTPARGFRFVAAPNVSDVSVVQVVLSTRDGHRWVVLLDPARATTAVTVPQPPAGFVDRTWLDGVGSTRGTLRVQTLRLSSSSRLGFASVVEFGAVPLDDLTGLMTGFASMDYP
jgi:hypothetical protein